MLGTSQAQQPGNPRADADGDLCSIPQTRGMMPSRETECCCGRASCAYLKHNNEALDGLEKDVRTAAQLGQALLVRHEAYIFEAEESRRQMSLRVDALELDKRNLEAENARTAQENRDLLEHLDQLNTTVAESQGHVMSLEATLQSTQLELKRLEALASRTHDLEAPLVELEKEQEHLIETVVSTEAEERSAIRRWREAERRLGQVQDQLERIEREAGQERDRHDEVLRRMDRQKLVDKELRAKSSGRATVSTGGHGTNVVSHFVKDILQDNVNLQMGIVELRDMLMTSNDEVQKLREQLMVHQPLQDGDVDEDTAPSTLKEELAVKEPVVTSQALHVHHHYHAPAKKEEIRRTVPKKKRNVSLNLQSTPSRINTRGYRMRQSQSSAAATILSQTSTTIPSPRTPNRWSMQSASVASDFASSAPSSPQSNFRNSYLFDRMSMDQSTDFSRPTSPGSSVDPLSPVFKPMHHKRPSELSNHSSKGQPVFQTGTIREEEDSDVTHLLDLEAPSNNEPAPHDCNISINVVSAEDPATFDPFAPDDYQPKLRRSNSHESILSLSRLDIHTLKSRPSQIALRGSRALIWPRTPQGLSSPSTSFLSTHPILSSAEPSAPTLSRQNYDSSSLLRSTMGIPSRPPSRTSTASGDTAAPKKPGGWIWSRWGVSPAPSTASSPTASLSGVPSPDPKRLMPAQRAASTPIGRETSKDPLRAMMGRSPGINQRGPIPGLRKAERAAPSQVTPETVDWEALREVLEE